MEVEDLCQYRQELSSTGDVITTAAQNPGAIGYASLASVKDTVKAVKVGGVAPSEQSVKHGSSFGGAVAQLPGQRQEAV